MHEIDKLLQGSIDMHLHHGPDAVTARRVDALAAAQQAEQAGMRAIVLKNHHYPTTAMAIVVQQITPAVVVFGSLSLDFEIGGLNLHALETSAKLGAKVAWMPTFSAANSLQKTMAIMGKTSSLTGLSILGTNGKLVAELAPILEVIKAHEIVLATGHLSPRETFALVEEGKRVGIRRCVITHPLEVEVADEPLNMADLKALAASGAYIEMTFLGLLPTMGWRTAPEVASAIREIGAEHCIMSSDLGQVENPPPAEGMRMFIATLLKQGLSAREIELMAKVNPAKLLGLE